MMNKKAFSIALSLIMAMPMMAQSLSGESEYRYNDATQLWRNTANTAGMTIDSARSRGKVELQSSHTSGTYHRVQEGNQTNQLHLFTERYQQMGKYLYGYGKFDFNMGRTKERSWSDVMRTYNSNPFYAGSSVMGKYDFQNFDLSARVATVDFSGWRFGASLDYKVGDLSRLRDPRSRARLLDYKISPSIAYTFGNHTVGISGSYNRYKENEVTPITVQEEPNMYYYQMTGLEASTGTLKGWSGFSREYVNHVFGGELSYGYHSDNYQNVSALSISRGTEYIYEQYKREPDRYMTYHYGLSTQNRVHTESMLHQIDIKAEFEQAYADEYRPKLIITKDSIHGYTSNNYINEFTYKKRYQLETSNLDFHYRGNLLDGESIYSYFGILASYNHISQKHLLPESSFKHKSLDLNAEYGIALLKDHRLWIDVNTGYHFVNQSKLQLADESTLFAQQVLIPDMQYYQSNHWNGRLQLTWQQPITIKGYQSQWYIRGYAQTIQTQNHLHGNTFGITIGLFN